MLLQAKTQRDFKEGISNVQSGGGQKSKVG
jgi:hypothetical protein